MNSLDRPGESQSILAIWLNEWKWWAPGLIFSFFLASILLSGWPAGLKPNLSYPFVFSSDGLSHSWLVQRAIEGWIFDNPRSGYPFGSNFLDYPGSDSGSLLILKILGILTGSFYASLNIYTLLSFPVCFLTSFVVLRSIGMKAFFAFSASLLFTFQSFHFFRLHHPFYLWYFVVPIYFYFAFKFIIRQPSIHSEPTGPVTQVLVSGLLLMVTASFGVYYALFGIIAIVTAGIFAWNRSGSIRSFTSPFVAIGFVLAGVTLNLLPSVVHKQVNGHNTEVAQRSAFESEVYGFKLAQIVLPATYHRIDDFSTFAKSYNKTRPLVNENHTASIGVVGSLGFLGLIIFSALSLGSSSSDQRISFAAAVTFVFFLFGTIGGFGSLFATIISPDIRGWNRISIFIAFSSLTAFFIALQVFLKKLPSFYMRRSAIWLIIFSVTVFGILDQTPTPKTGDSPVKLRFDLERQFIEDIEQALPARSSVYQLPYMPFPEAPPLHQLEGYGLIPAFLFSKTTSWSYGGMRGREGDLFFRSLAKAKVEKQLQVLRRIGFDGIYIDRRGYTDNGNSIITEFSDALGSKPQLTRSDGKIVFFLLPNSDAPNLNNLDAQQIMSIAQYNPGR